MMATIKTAASILLHLLMLAAVLALWNNDAPQFIYVAF
jgi:hypothetical protein